MADEPFNDRWLRETIARQEQLQRAQFKCPACCSPQVQLVGKLVPAQWKCRMCKQLFATEPRNNDLDERNEQE